MSGALQPYLSVFAGRFQLTLQYRTAALAGFATQLWFGVIRILIFAAFYASGAQHAPMSLANAVTYSWLGQAFLVFLPWSVDPDVADMMRTGAVAYERLRPVDTYAWWYARAMARTLARVAPRAALMVGFAAVLLPLVGLGQWALALPSTPAAGGWFLVSVVGLTVLSAAVGMLINVILVAVMQEGGVNALASAVVNFFSGVILPLAFFPDAIRPWLRALPFAGLMDLPFSIYLGRITGPGVCSAIALQFGWTVALILIGHWLLGRTMRRLQIQGG